MESKQYIQAVEQYGDAVFHVAYSYCKNRSDSEDVVQNTFLKLFQNKGTFSDEEHLKRWLLRVAINEAKNYCTSFWKKRVIPLEESEKIPDVQFHDSANQRLYDAVMNLGEKYRVVVHLYYYEGYSIKEISEITKVKVTTIQTRLMRARMELKNVLKEDFSDEELYL